MAEERRHLTGKEVERMLAATKGQRHAARDRCMLLLIYRHGLRASEACKMPLSAVSIEERHIYCGRLKRGLSTSQPLRDDEIRVPKAWLKERDSHKGAEGSTLFLSERGTGLGRQQVYNLVKRYGELAGLDIEAHPHMLRHACGFALADQGADTRLIQDYLGHRNIQHTVRYTASNPERFERLWKR